MRPGIWSSKATTSARTRGERSHSAPGTTGKVSEANDGSDDGGHQGAAEVMTTKYSAMSTLQEILSYRVEGSPLPLIVAAAGPRARLAGEQVAVLLLPGAATSLHGDAATGLRTTPATQLRRTVAPSTSHKTPAFTCSSDPLSGLAASVVDDSHLHYCRVVRGSSLEGVTAAMCEAARWYGRPATSTPADPALEASYHLANEDDGEEAGSAVSSGRVKNGHIDVFVPSGLPSAANYQSLCVPLCLEVVAPRLILPAATARHTCADGAAVVRLWRKAQTKQRWCGDESIPADPADAQLQDTAAEFVPLVDQLWRLRRYALVELLIEGYPLMVTEWILSPELRRPADAQRTAENQTYATEAKGTEIARVRWALRCMCVLRCRGKATLASVVTAGEAATAAGRAAHWGIPSAASAVPGRGLRPAFPAAAAGVALSLSLTAVRPHLRLLDLSNTTTLSSLDGIEVLVALEKIELIRCSQLHSLSPLETASSLKDTVASQSCVLDLSGVVQKITVRVFDGLRESRSLARLGMRYGDAPLLKARSLVSSLTVLHAFSTTLTSVVALQHCTALEVADVSACAPLADLGTLDLAPCLREVDAAGSGVLHVSGLSRSCSLERFLLAQCVHLDEVGPLGQCVDLRELRPHWRWCSAVGRIGSRPLFESPRHQFLPPAAEFHIVAGSSAATLFVHKWLHSGPATN
ncbi:hypothetical protein CGC21_10910 [Leishmania donovani]|uniref:Uncharacterized protein n=1 Tax=Leishmania donovani TaxID=5661 RepID=A0A504XC55_LEIDO|nr:hypothetical protein CGC21_10910 [Leishmania donovani]